MAWSQKKTLVAVAALCAAFLSAPLSSRAEDLIEKAGVGIGITAGNLIFVPSKALSVVAGAAASALSFLATGGDVEVSRQIWRNTLEGPYVITPSVARASIGERPLPERR